MSFVASASGVIHASRADCFSRLRDFSSWRRWMPGSFRPVRGPGRDLEIGDRLLLRIAAEPRYPSLLVPVTVVRVEANCEITWRGGIPGLLLAEHAFFFEDAEGGATLVRSEETWSGAVAGIAFVATRVRPSVSRIGQEQIEALAGAVEKRN